MRTWIRTFKSFIASKPACRPVRRTYYASLEVLEGRCLPAQVLWVGETDNWNTRSNWQGLPFGENAPGEYDHVTIAGAEKYPKLTSNAEVNTLTVQTRGQLDIVGAVALTVNGDVVNNGRIEFKGNGYLGLTAGTFTNNAFLDFKGAGIFRQM